MIAKFMVVYKESSWTDEESPAEYFQTLEDAVSFFRRAVDANTRFRVISLFEINGPDCTLLKEIDLGPANERP